MIINPTDDPEHMRRVQERCASLQHDSRLHQRVAHINDRAPLITRERLLQQVHTVGAGKRIHWLRREADLVGQAAAGATPCRTGCASCCHISVLVAHAEAVEIGKGIGRTPQALRADRTITPAALLNPTPAALAQYGRLQAEYFGKPCVFLGRDSDCTIYEHRPLACRYHFSLDDDDLLCRPVDGAEVPLPMLDTRPEKATYLLALGLHQKLADVRDWFPGGPGT